MLAINNHTDCLLFSPPQYILSSPLALTSHTQICLPPLSAAADTFRASGGFHFTTKYQQLAVRMLDKTFKLETQYDENAFIVLFILMIIHNTRIQGMLQTSLKPREKRNRFVVENNNFILPSV